MCLVLFSSINGSILVTMDILSKNRCNESRAVCKAFLSTLDGTLL
jgi:hypothetical protein